MCPTERRNREMHCSQCGNYNSDDAALCSVCGAALQQAVQEGKVKAKDRVFGEVLVNDAQKTKDDMRPDYKAVTTLLLKEVLAGPLFLIAIIVYTAMVVLSFIQVQGSSDFIHNGLGSVDMLTWLRLLSIVGVAVGLWIAFVCAGIKRYHPINSLGLKVVKIALCVNVFIFFAELLTYASLVSKILKNHNEDEVCIVLGLIVILIALGAVLSLLIRNLNVATETMKKGAPDRFVSKVVAILMIAVGVAGGTLGVCGLLGDFVIPAESLFGELAVMVFGFVEMFSYADLAAVVSLILFGCTMLQFRDRMEIAWWNNYN